MLETWADGRDELVLFGRQPLFAHDNTHHALGDGPRRGVVPRARPARSTRARWRTLRTSFRDHVVED